MPRSRESSGHQLFIDPWEYFITYDERSRSGRALFRADRSLPVSPVWYGQIVREERPKQEYVCDITQADVHLALLKETA